MPGKPDSKKFSELSRASKSAQNLPCRLVPLRPSTGIAAETNEFHCPKCLRAVRKDSVSCPKCALIFALWEKGVARVPGMAAGTGDVDPMVEALWDVIENDPEDEAGHEAFLNHCRDSRCLDLAAAKYQELLFKNPDSKTGRAFRERIILLAQFNSPPTSKPRKEPGSFAGVKIILLLGTFSLLMALMMARNLLVR